MKIVFTLLIALIMAAPLSLAQTNPARQYEESRGTEPPVDGLWHAYDRKGNLLREENYKNYRLDGEMKIFYPSGALKEQLYYVDGTRQGPDKTYYESGSLEGQSNYVNNDLEGISTHYYDTGEVESQFYYTHGNLDGPKKVYYKNGVIKQTMTYTNGVLNGTVFTYSPDEQVVSEEFYLHGDLTSRKDYSGETLSSTKAVPDVGQNPNTDQPLSDAVKIDTASTTNGLDPALSKPKT